MVIMDLLGTVTVQARPEIIRDISVVDTIGFVVVTFESGFKLLAQWDSRLRVGLKVHAACSSLLYRRSQGGDSVLAEAVFVSHPEIVIP